MNNEIKQYLDYSDLKEMKKRFSNHLKQVKIEIKREPYREHNIVYKALGAIFGEFNAISNKVEGLILPMKELENSLKDELSS